MAPRCDLEVHLREPELHFTGTAYHDSNAGNEPLDDGFTGWHWARAHDSTHTRVVYDAQLRRGASHCIAARIDSQGQVYPFAPGLPASLGRSWWGIRRQVRSSESGALVSGSLEDTPFYARSQIETSWEGRRLSAIGEHLDLDRFRRGWEIGRAHV